MQIREEQHGRPARGPAGMDAWWQVHGQGHMYYSVTASLPDTLTHKINNKCKKERCSTFVIRNKVSLKMGRNVSQILKEKCFLFRFTYLSILCTCLSVYYMCTWCPQGQKRASDSLGLELEMIVKTLWVLGTEPWSSRGRSIQLKHRAMASAPICWTFGP